MSDVCALRRYFLKMADFRLMVNMMNSESVHLYVKIVSVTHIDFPGVYTLFDKKHYNFVLLYISSSLSLWCISRACVEIILFENEVSICVKLIPKKNFLLYRDQWGKLNEQ